MTVKFAFLKIHCYLEAEKVFKEGCISDIGGDQHGDEDESFSLLVSLD